MNYRRISAAVAAVGLAALVLAGCSSSSGGSSEPAASGGTSVEGAPDWCGPNEAIVGLLDGFGGNSWRLVTTAAGADEVAKCPSVTDYQYADGQGDTQKSISDIQGMVASGVNAIVVFPDAGEAMLPALRSAYEAGVVTVPYRVDPGGKAGVDYDVWVGADFVADGKHWGNWIKDNFPDGANILFLSGPAGNSQGIDERTGFEVRPDGSQVRVPRRAALRGHQLGPGADPAGADRRDRQVRQDRRHRLGLRPVAGRRAARVREERPLDPRAGHLGRQRAGLLLAGEGGHEPGLLAVHGRDGQRQRPPRRAVRGRQGHRRRHPVIRHASRPRCSRTRSRATRTRSPCRDDLPGDIYLSAEMSAEDQAALLK